MLPIATAGYGRIARVLSAGLFRFGMVIGGLIRSFDALVDLVRNALQQFLLLFRRHIGRQSVAVGNSLFHFGLFGEARIGLIQSIVSLSACAAAVSIVGHRGAEAAASVFILVTRDIQSLLLRQILS